MADADAERKAARAARKKELRDEKKRKAEEERQRKKALKRRRADAEQAAKSHGAAANVLLVDRRRRELTPLDTQPSPARPVADDATTATTVYVTERKDRPLSQLLDFDGDRVVRVDECLLRGGSDTPVFPSKQPALLPMGDDDDMSLSDGEATPVPLPQAKTCFGLTGNVHVGDRLLGIGIQRHRDRVRGSAALISAVGSSSTRAEAGPVPPRAWGVPSTRVEACLESPARYFEERPRPWTARRARPRARPRWRSCAAARPTTTSSSRTWRPGASRTRAREPCGYSTSVDRETSSRPRWNPLALAGTDSDDDQANLNALDDLLERSPFTSVDFDGASSARVASRRRSVSCLDGPSSTRAEDAPSK